MLGTQLMKPGIGFVLSLFEGGNQIRLFVVLCCVEFANEWLLDGRIGLSLVGVMGPELKRQLLV